MKLKLTPKLNMQLYGLLLIITPFLLLQNYLQDAMGMFSRLKLPLGSFEIPVVVLIAFLLIILAGYFLVKNLTKIRLFGLLWMIFLFWVGYNTSDYYYNHHYYDIQHNWHYFAYAIYTWLVWRHLFNGKRSVEKVILYTFLLSLFLSLVDEIIQVFISDRVFDLSDVGKDLWGCMIGQFFIHIVIFNMKHLSFRKYWQFGINNWAKSGMFLLTLQLLFAWIFLNVSSLLSSAEFSGQVTFITLLLFAAFAFLFQSSGKKPARYFVIAILCFLVFYPIIRLNTSPPHVSWSKNNIVTYKGVPVIHFDVMIYPNGMIRLVDKKTSFNIRDKQKINTFGADIVILATGSKGQGGKGYHDQLKVEMGFNPTEKKVYQIIKLPNIEACKLYNKLIKEGKKILMIIHNS